MSRGSFPCDASHFVGVYLLHQPCNINMSGLLCRTSEPLYLLSGVDAVRQLRMSWCTPSPSPGISCRKIAWHSELALSCRIWYQIRNRRKPSRRSCQEKIAIFTKTDKLHILGHSQHLHLIKPLHDKLLPCKQCIQRQGEYHTFKVV